MIKEVKMPRCEWCAKPFFKKGMILKDKPRGISIRRADSVTCCKACSRMRIHKKKVQSYILFRKRLLARNCIKVSG